MPATVSLDVPLLLIAMPQVMDPFFHKSVILLVHHDDEGSVGFILNRKTEITISGIMQGMELLWSGEASSVARFGGPVQPQLGTVLYPLDASDHGLLEGSAEVVPGVGISQHIGDLEALGLSPPERLRLLLGYSGWGASQLTEEIVRNDWLTVPCKPELIWSEPPEAMWSQALETVGVDPATLPAWSPAIDSEEAN